MTRCQATACAVASRDLSHSGLPNGPVSLKEQRLLMFHTLNQQKSNKTASGACLLHVVIPVVQAEGEQELLVRHVQGDRHNISGHQQGLQAQQQSKSCTSGKATLLHEA